MKRVCYIEGMMLEINKKVKRRVYTGDGSSLYSFTRRITYAVNWIRLVYVNWLAKEKYLTQSLFASINMYGPNTSSEQYTDKGIVQGINRDEYMLSEIRSLIESTIKERGIYKPVPEIKVGWSDYKVQPETGWNFDIFETEGVRR